MVWIILNFKGRGDYLNKKIILLSIFIIAVVIVAIYIYKSTQGLVSDQTILSNPTETVLLSPTSILTPTPIITPTPLLSPIPSNSDYPNKIIPFTSDLQNKIFGKWKTKFYAWDSIGRDDWDPMVLDKKVVTVSKDEVTYLDYDIKNPQFNSVIYYDIEEHASYHQYPTEITQFHEDIIDISILAVDESSYPYYYSITFSIIGDKIFLWYQGAYFEVEKIE